MRAKAVLLCLFGLTIRVRSSETTKPNSETCPPNDPNCSSWSTSQECGIWYAASTIPKSGIGMFAGRDFVPHERLVSSGDLTIPVIDVLLHQGDDFWWLWDEYTWTGTSLYFDHEGVHDVVGASPGFGAVANSMLDLWNVEEGVPQHDTTGLERSRDPGAGAFSPYYNRVSTAKAPLQAGDELFVTYGENWFDTREHSMGPIPHAEDIPSATSLLKQFKRIEAPPLAKQELWETFVIKSPYLDSSRILNVFPKTWNETVEMLEIGVLQTRKKDKRRSLEWLVEHGTCADHTRVNTSTIRQAGHGAFAARFLPKGSVVQPVPLIHVPYREWMGMYKTVKDEDGQTITDTTQPVQPQLLLNYCYGHSESTVLLCPYGIHNGMVNHHGSRANLKLRWADPNKSSHRPDWLNLTVEELSEQFSAGLAMEFVATRDIAPGDELFLDYGQEWEDAWTRHVAKWTPVNGSDTYRNAFRFNNDKISILRTAFDEIPRPFYPGNVELQCDNAFAGGSWTRYFPQALEDVVLMGSGDGLSLCDLMRWKIDEQGFIRYTALLNLPDEPEMTKLNDVPRDAFRFVDRPYTSDLHLPNAFRHPMMIPDELFPDKWKNKRRNE